jgi:hypothetical protein
MRPFAGEKYRQRSTIAYGLIFELKVGLSPTDDHDSSAGHSTSTWSVAQRFAGQV